MVHKNKNLIFTSAGDNSNISLWLNGLPNFDLWICYYGENETEYSQIATYFSQRKGGKYQNLYSLFQKSKHIFTQYDSIMVLDDDIILTTEQINKLFNLRKQFDLKLLHPGFDKTGKISHSITARHPLTKLRYTNFIEVTAPIFKTQNLIEFMDLYDPLVNATGVDWWFCTNIDIQSQTQRDIAISDEIWCINPHDLDKSDDGIREINRLLSNEKRIENWQEVKKKHNLQYLEEGNYKTYKNIYQFNLYQIVSWFLSYPRDIYFRLLRKLKNNL